MIRVTGLVSLCLLFACNTPTPTATDAAATAKTTASTSAAAATKAGECGGEGEACACEGHGAVAKGHGHDKTHAAAKGAKHEAGHAKADHSACSCSIGKKGGTTWCDSCSKGYIDGKATKDKAAVKKARTH